MPRRLAWALAGLPMLWAPGVEAQVPHGPGTIPGRTALLKVGLERQWSAAVPLRPGAERVLGLNLVGSGRNEPRPGAVYAAGASATGFISNSTLSGDDDYYVGADLVFTAGANAKQSRPITGYTGKTRAFAFRTPFPAAPAEGDAFEIRGYNEKIVGKVDSVPPAANKFMTDSDLAPTDDYYVGSTLVFTSGKLAGQAREVLHYRARARTFELAIPLEEAPADGDTFSLRGGLLIAQTSSSNIHAFDGETGQFLWSANVGAPRSDFRAAAANSSMVFAANTGVLYALDRQTGRELFKVQVESVSGGKPTASLSSSPPAADEETVLVGLTSGKVVGYAAKTQTDPTNPTGALRRPGAFLWAWKSELPVRGRPLVTERLVAFASDDGAVYVAVNRPPTLLYRFRTGGPIRASLAPFGGRTLMVASADFNIYAIDLFSAERKWVVPTGAAVLQEPLVARGETEKDDHDVYLVNTAGTLMDLDPETGKIRWTRPTGGATLMAVAKDRIYLNTAGRQLLVVHREDGRDLYSAQDTLGRAGLDLRDYEIALTNHVNDRLYYCTPSGSLLCLRQAGELMPRELRDPREPRFGSLLGAGPATQPAPTPEAPPADKAADKAAEAETPK